MIAAAKRFRRDHRGVAAIEFALMAPFLVALYLGAIELMLAFQALTRMSHMATAMADMASQNRTISAAELDEIMRAGSVMAYPLPSGPLGQRISSIRRDANGAVSVSWSRASNYSGAAPQSPAGFLQPGESLIVADVSYDYPTAFALLLPTQLRFERHAYLRPRLTDAVAGP